jgi:DMSO/TMAO reductase YedYZ molybdopterin-dependent catalytic subunit
VDERPRTRETGLIVRQLEPINLETPFDQADSYLTPTELFFVRCHFSVPTPDPTAYELHIDGAVRTPVAMGYEQLRAMPSETRVATLECAGNSRVFLVPQTTGAQWELGAVGTAEWTGVPLATLLEEAGLDDDVSEIVLEGADRGTPTEPPVPPGMTSYARSLPRGKALQREVLIAYLMNGRDLQPEHGYPVRAVVPGHYGMASVKWLTHIHAVRKPFLGYWQTSDYAYWDDADGRPVRRALGPMHLKSEIARPRVRETLAPNTVYPMSGAAWAGETDVTAVGVSTDGGRTWADAELIDPAQRYAWRRWRYDWQTPTEAGRYTLMARAVGAAGDVQPEGHDQNNGSYVIDHPLPIEVFVAPPARPVED